MSKKHPRKHRPSVRERRDDRRRVARHWVYDLGRVGLRTFGRQMAKNAATGVASYVSNRLPWRNAGTQTKTYTKRMKSVMQGTSQHNDASTRSFSKTLKKRTRKRLPGDTRFRFTESWDVIINGEEGKQAVSALKAIAPLAMYNGSASVTSRQSINGCAVNPYELNPHKSTSGSTLYPGIPGATAISNDKLYHKTVFGKCHVANLTNVPTVVKLYWLLCKKTTKYDPSQTFANALTDIKMTGTGMGYQPDVQVPSATPGIPGVNEVGLSPFQLQMFKNVWKNLHCEVFTLQGGDQVSTSFKFKLNRLINRSTFEEFDATADVYVGGYTIIPLLICNAGLVTVNDGSPGNPEVTYGKPKVGVLICQTHVFEPIADVMRNPTYQWFAGHVSKTPAHTEGIIIDTDAAGSRAEV